MRGFTSVAERTEAESLVTVLNEHLEAMTPIIMEHEGTLDKFMGDEVMALFGAPLPLEDHALRAVRTALEMQRAHKELMARWEAAGREAVPIGIGINSGDVIVGQIGSSKFTDYTVIGDNVNLGSRLCGVAKGHQILISEATYQLVRHAAKVNKLALIQVKGRVQPVQTYEVIGLK
jgi:adenylate cyclase